jgi:propanol-preferring alcohol dehydrogenase
MKAIKMLGNRKLELKEFPDPKARDDWVLVEVKASALCGTDLHFFYQPTNKDAYNHNKIIPGHEIAGVVRDIDKAERLKVGDRVVVYPFIGCNNCFSCTHKLWKACKDWKVVGFDVNGGHAEYLTVPERNLQRVPDDISDSTAALIWDGIGASYGAIKKLNVIEKDIVAIFGCGPIGLGALNNCKFRGATVIAIDPLEDRLQTANKVGADYVINPQEKDANDRIIEISSGYGPDVCLECSGNEKALHQALELVRHGGRCGLIGEQGEVHALNISDEIIHRDLTLAGSLTYEYDKLDELIGLIRKGLNVEKIMTHSFSLDESEKAWDLFDKGKTGKVVIHP